MAEPDTAAHRPQRLAALSSVQQGADAREGQRMTDAELALVETVRDALLIFESPDDGSDEFFGKDPVTKGLDALRALAQRLADAERRATDEQALADKALESVDRWQARATRAEEALRARDTHLRAEWYRKGLHDPKSLTAEEVRTSVRLFGSALFAAPTEEPDRCPACGSRFPGRYLNRCTHDWHDPNGDAGGWNGSMLGPAPPRSLSMGPEITAQGCYVTGGEFHVSAGSRVSLSTFKHVKVYLHLDGTLTDCRLERCELFHVDERGVASLISGVPPEEPEHG